MKALIVLFLITCLFFNEGDAYLKRDKQQITREVRIIPANVTQNSFMPSHEPELAIDNDNTTYSSTSGTGNPSPEVWQALLGGYYFIKRIEIINVQDTKKMELLRDITIEIQFNFTSNFTEDFTFFTPDSASFTLNRNGGIRRPSSLAWDVYQEGYYLGNLVRVRRLTPNLNNETIQNPDNNILAMAEVIITGIRHPCIPACDDPNAECEGSGIEVECVCKIGYFKNSSGLCEQTKGEPFFYTLSIPEVTTQFQTISYGREIENPVIACSPHYQLPQKPTVVRLENITSTHFEIKIQHASATSSPLPPTRVYCVITQEGVYNGMEAFRVNTTKIDYGISDNWNGKSVYYYYRYNQPVVVGQIASFNDESWSSFWAASQDDNTKPPSSGESFRIGRQCGSDTTRNPLEETIHYIVIDQGKYSKFETGLFSAHSLPNSSPQTGTLSSLAGVVASPAGAQQTGYFTVVENIDNNNFFLGIDTDNNTRTLSNEQVGTLLFSSADLINSDCSERKSKCDCLNGDDLCGWCEGENSACYRKDSGSSEYCTSMSSQWEVTPVNCVPEPQSISIPSQQPQSLPSPQIPPAKDNCKTKTLCECLSDSQCGWCSYNNSSEECELATQIDNCQQSGGNMIFESKSCSESNTYKATQGLSGFGDGYKNYSSIVVISLGGLLLIASVIIVIVFRVYNPSDNPRSIDHL